MKIALVIAFSLYLLVDAYYNLYGKATSTPDEKEVILRAIWHSSKELYTVFLTCLLFAITFDVKMKIVTLISMVYLAFKTIFHAFNILGIASVTSELWSGFSFLIIFILILTLLNNE